MSGFKTKWEIDISDFQKLLKALGKTEKEEKQLISAIKKYNTEQKKSQGIIEKLEKELHYLEKAKKGAMSVKEVRQFNKKIDETQHKLNRLNGSSGKSGLSGIMGSLKSMGPLVAGAFAASSVISFGQEIVNVGAEFEKLHAILQNTLGSEGAADAAFGLIKNVASETPFQVKELTDSYVKLVNSGFKPAKKELTALGDIAASKGKSFDQLTEAFIDAQTGEFERLKEFGIKASKSGDEVSFTFKEQTTTVENTSSAIKDYLIGLGQMEGVSGAMAAISETATGKMSNFQDQMDSLKNDTFQELMPVIKEAIAFFSALIGEIRATGVIRDLIVYISGASREFGGLLKALGLVNDEVSESKVVARAFVFALKAIIKTMTLLSLPIKNSIGLIKNWINVFKGNKSVLTGFQYQLKIMSFGLIDFSRDAKKATNSAKEQKETLKSLNQILEAQAVKLGVSTEAMQKYREQFEIWANDKSIFEIMDRLSNSADEEAIINGLQFEIDQKKKAEKEKEKAKTKAAQAAQKLREDQRKAAQELLEKLEKLEEENNLESINDLQKRKRQEIQIWAETERKKLIELQKTANLAPEVYKKILEELEAKQQRLLKNNDYEAEKMKINKSIQEKALALTKQFNEGEISSREELNDQLEQLQLDTLMMQLGLAKAYGKKTLELEKQIADANANLRDEELADIKKTSQNALNIARSYFNQRQSLLQSQGPSGQKQAIMEQFQFERNELDRQLADNLILEEEYNNKVLQLTIQRMNALKELANKENTVTGKDTIFSGTKKFQSEKQATIRHFDEMISLRKQYGLETTELEQKKANEINAINNKSFEFVASRAQGMLDMATQALTSINQIIENKLQNQLGIIEEQRTAELDSLESSKERELSISGRTAEQKQQIEKMYSERRAETERKYAERKAKEEAKSLENKKKYYRIQKVIDLAQATISTSLGVAKALELGPVGIPLSVAIGVLGALQVAAIATQPAAFFKGGVNIQRGANPHGRDTIPAMLNEGESVITTQNTRDYLPAVQAIHNGTVSSDIMNHIAKLKPTSMADLNNKLIGNPILIPKVGFGKNLPKTESRNHRDLEKSVIKAISKLPINQFIMDEHGFSKKILKNGNQTEFLNRRS